MNDQAFAGPPEHPRPGMMHSEIHLRDLTAVVVRHWLLVVALAALVGAGAYYSGRRTVHQWQSTLTVQINSPKQMFARLNDIDFDEFALRTDPILSEALVLTTQSLALHVVRAVNLQLDIRDPSIFRGTVMTDIDIDSTRAPPRRYQLALDSQGFQLRDVAGTAIGSGTLADRVVGPGFSFTLLPPAVPITIDFDVVSPQVAASSVSGGLSYQVRDGTNAVDIWYTGTDPSLVPVVLNEAAVQLRNLGVRRARDGAAARRQYIERQLAQSDSAYQQSLRDLQAFKEGQQITDLSVQQTAIVQSIRQLEQDRQLALVQLATIEDAMSVSDSIGVETLNRLAAIEGIGANAALSFQIRGLLQRYDDRRALTAGALGFRESNPQVGSIDQQIREGHAALVSAVGAMLQSIQSRVDALDRELAGQRDVLGEIPGMETRIGQLNLKTTILDETHRYLLEQYQAARMQEATIAPYIQVLDSASPAFRIGASVRQRVILGILVGLLLGLGGAFFLEYLDQTVKSSSDIERVLGVPVLGLIPHEAKLISRSNGRRTSVVTIDRLDAGHPAVESYRALRTNVTFVGSERPLQFIAVTSPGPREGKSTTAVNLAVTLAQRGRRTMLIDGDLRRSTLHRAFGTTQEPGLTDVLIGGSTATEAIRTEVAPYLDLLTSGSTPPNPSELLGSSAMDAVVSRLRGDYEYIIIDTPPTLPVTDAAVVGTIADATILVIRSGHTEEHAAQRAVAQLRRVQARIAGAVLNAVSPPKDPQYTYLSQRDPPSRSRFKALASKVGVL